MKEKVIVFGTGTGAEKALKELNRQLAEVVCFTDNDEQKWGESFCGRSIIPPQELVGKAFDKIMICSSYAYEQIRKQLVAELYIAPEKIVNRLYFHKLSLLNRYDGNGDPEIEQIMHYLQNHDLQVFNYEWAEDYNRMPVDAQYDIQVQMWYINYFGKRMYLKRSFRTKQDAVNYGRALYMEQHENSPHKYLRKNCQTGEKAVIIDAGVAEGNFALEVIENAKKLYLIESDKEWMEALQITFRPWQEKVVFINKFLGEYVDDRTITLDCILEKDAADFIKMDIEGAEVSALKGGKAVLKNSKHLKLAVCSYHHTEDEVRLKDFLQEKGYQCQHSPGYMVYIPPEKLGKCDNIRLVRGLLYAER